MNMNQLLNELKCQQVALWLDCEELRLSSKQDLGRSPLLARLKASKPALTRLLRENRIHSKRAFRNRTIFRLTGHRFRLSFAQERLLFVSQYGGGDGENSAAFHIPHLSRLKAAANWEALERALQRVVTAHPILNTVYRVDANGEYYQESLLGPLPVATIEHIPDQALETRVAALVSEGFDLASAPPMRVARLKTDGNHTYVLFVWHHIAFDGWSLGVFFDQLEQYYKEEVESQNSIPTEARGDWIRYVDYAEWQREMLQGETLASLWQYWRRHLEGCQALAIPTDPPPPVPPSRTIAV
jgi:hypothetical protein